MEAKGKSKNGRLGVNIGAETANQLLEIKDELQKKLGIDLSFTQVIEYLVKQYRDGQSGK